MKLLTIHVDLNTFSCISFGFEIGPWFALISFAKWSLEITLDISEFR